jgi:vacuolar iron transporter family protein
MKTMEVDINTLDLIKQFQKNEITECQIYRDLAKREKDESNKKVLEDIANDEFKHYKIFKHYSNVEIAPDKLKIFWYYWLARILGITFSIKLMEKGEGNAQLNYAVLSETIPEAKKIILDEDGHEKELIDLIKEERLNYVGSIVLGLNDALIELTGVLAGLSFALQNTRLIAVAGLITGIAAAFSMAASEYLSQKEEGSDNPVKSSIYTGLTYIATVALLIFPYLIFSSYLICIAITLFVAILIIMFFTYYISVAKDLPFKRRFLEMAIISLTVSAITFGIGILVKKFIGVNI